MFYSLSWILTVPHLHAASFHVEKSSYLSPADITMESVKIMLSSDLTFVPGLSRFSCSLFANFKSILLSVPVNLSRLGCTQLGGAI